MNDSLPDDLAKLQTRFEHWRKTHTMRSRIPEDLLQAARLARPLFRLDSLPRLSTSPDLSPPAQQVRNNILQTC